MVSGLNASVPKIGLQTAFIDACFLQLSLAVGGGLANDGTITSGTPHQGRVPAGA